MPDPIFAHRRLAAIYDEVDLDRSDLDHYAAIVDELGARSVLDIGCGTGTFACALAGRGIQVVGVDPAAASLDVARGKEHGDAVQWVAGETSALPPLCVDLVVMTANVAQVFLTDDEWAEALAAAHRSLRPGGFFVFETRDPAARDWEAWTRERSIATVPTSEGPVETWVELIEVALPHVSFRWTFRFLDDDEQLTSTSTLRFHTRSELATSLDATGFITREIREAPDRPGKEWVYVAQRT